MYKYTIAKFYRRSSVFVNGLITDVLPHYWVRTVSWLDEKVHNLFA